MLSKRPTVLIAAVLAVIAGVAAYAEVHGAQQRAYKNTTLTTVYAASRTVPREESLSQAVSQGIIKATKMPLQFRPAGAVTATTAGTLAKDEATFNIPAGTVVTADMFAAPQALASVAAETVPPGDVAISVSVDQVHGVAGLIQPGDKVDILVDVNGTESYLYQSVPVLAVGTTLVTASSSAREASADASANSGNGTQQTNNVITFAVTPAAAARIALANTTSGGGSGATSGGVYLALQAAGESTSSVASVNQSNLVSGASGSASASSSASTSSASAGSSTAGGRVNGQPSNGP